MKTIKKTAALTVGIAALVMSGAGVANASSEAEGAAVGSPGILSGNNIQLPIHIPVNVCGNSINIIGLLNPAIGNTCINADGGHEKGEHHEGSHHGHHER
ncbi:chaplin [Embleya sp. AB8]|uniref:chaplin n=1 Tax=Embleya sp. AB8 TaxID=3156304 RepID=UPI003C7561D2